MLTPDINDIFGTCVCNLVPRVVAFVILIRPDPSNFLASFDLFQNAWLVLARIATPDDIYSDLENSPKKARALIG